MYKVIVALLLFVSANCLAERTWLGRSHIVQISYAESSNICGEAGGPCLAIFFAEPVHRCQPESNYLAISKSQAEYAQIESLALASLATKAKLKLYGSSEYCKDAEKLNPNGVTLYTQELW